MNDENQLSPTDDLSDFLLYTAPNGEVKVEVLQGEETVWLKKKLICELFGVSKGTISEHLKNIYSSKELTKEATVRNFRTVQMVGFAKRVNRFLEFNEYKILDGYGSIKRSLAEAKATEEYDKFNKLQKIESDFDKSLKSLELRTKDK